MRKKILNRALRGMGALSVPVLAVALLSGCSTSPQAASGGGEQLFAGEGATSYPLELTSPFGSTTLQAKPERVAVVSANDMDIALALGIVPVISPLSAAGDFEPASQQALDALGTPQPPTYDASERTQYEAIAAADPDVILAASGWNLEQDYARLSAIAPVVSYPADRELPEVSWQEQTRIVGQALDLPAKAEEVVSSVEKKFSDAAAAHPEFQGKSYTYAVLHPEQITYISTPDSTLTFFRDLGFVLPEQASQFSEQQATVSAENLSVLDADVLLIGYPFAEEGIMQKSELEANPLFQRIPAVAGGHYAAVDDAFASPLAYPTPLSEPWLLDQMLPVLEKAVQGKAK